MLQREVAERVAARAGRHELPLGVRPVPRGRVGRCGSCRLGRSSRRRRSSPRCWSASPRPRRLDPQHEAGPVAAGPGRASASGARCSTTCCRGSCRRSAVPRFVAALAGCRHRRRPAPPDAERGGVAGARRGRGAARCAGRPVRPGPVVLVASAPAKINLGLAITGTRAGRLPRAGVGVPAPRAGRYARGDRGRAGPPGRPDHRRSRLPGRRQPRAAGDPGAADSPRRPRPAPSCPGSWSRSPSASRWAAGSRAAARMPRRPCGSRRAPGGSRRMRPSLAAHRGAAGRGRAVLRGRARRRPGHRASARSSRRCRRSARRSGSC